MVGIDSGNAYNELGRRLPGAATAKETSFQLMEVDSAVPQLGNVRKEGESRNRAGHSSGILYVTNTGIPHNLVYKCRCQLITITSKNHPRTSGPVPCRGNPLIRMAQLASMVLSLKQ